MSRHPLLGALAATLIAGCATVPADGLPGRTAPLVSDRLFLGRSIPGGGEVDDRAFEAFVREEVSPRFPEGLTLWRAEGRWRESPGVTIDEAVTVIELIHPDTHAGSRDVAAIAEAYRLRFRQQAVLRVTIRAEARAAGG
jgi:hypothetical protein